MWWECHCVRTSGFELTGHVGACLGLMALRPCALSCPELDWPSVCIQHDTSSCALIWAMQVLLCVPILVFNEHDAHRAITNTISRPDSLVSG